MFDLHNRIALVTGGSRGIGSSVVMDLCRDCTLVAFTYAHNTQAAEEVVNQSAERGVRALPFQADVSDPTSMEAVFTEIANRHGPVDLLVNNAGINLSGPLITLQLQDWQRMLRVNLTGAFIACQLAALEMMRKGQGCIVNMTSITGLRGQPAQTGYSTTKAGLIGLTKSLAWELAEHGIRVNAIAPGWIDTGMAASMPDKKKKRALKLILSKRFGKPEEVAAAVRYLASSEGDYITGQVLTLDGGIQ